MKTNDKKKVEKLIAHGDSLLKKGRFKDALKEYKKARKLDPKRQDIYDRLVEAHDKSTNEWKPEDVVESVGYIMEKQELTNPAIKLLHQRLTPEWRGVIDKISELLMCDDEKKECTLIEEIQSFGKEAVYPLIYVLLQIKRGAGESGKEGKESCEMGKKGK